MARWLLIVLTAWMLSPVSLADEEEKQPDEELLEFLGLFEADEDEEWTEFMEIMAPPENLEQVSERAGDGRG